MQRFGKALLLLGISHNRDGVVGGCWWLLETANDVFLLQGESLAGQVVVHDGDRSGNERARARALHGCFNKVVLKNFAHFSLLLLDGCGSVYITNEHFFRFMRLILIGLDSVVLSVEGDLLDGDVRSLLNFLKVLGLLHCNA